MRRPFGFLVLAVFAGSISACLIGDFHPCASCSNDMTGRDLAGGDACSCRDMTASGDMAPPHCTTNTDCASHPTTPVCDTSSDACVECLASSDCTTAAAPVCEATHSCGACTASADCMRFSSTPVCNTSSGACVECLSKNDCDAAHKTCNTTTNMCAPCVSNSDCTSGLCMAGTCADKSTLLYVNNAASPACSDANGCTFMQPCCTVQKGLNTAAATGKQLVVFAGNVYAEALVANPAQNGGAAYVASAVGVGGPVVKPASGAILTLGSASAAAHVAVTLDGFTFDGATATDGLVCAGDATNYADTSLTVTRSTVSNATGIGVNSSGKCTLTMDADAITNNKGGGIKLDTTDFTLTNLLVSGNGTSSAPFGGIEITAAGEAGKMSIFNATIVSNTKTVGLTPSGVFCNSAAVAITNTVVFGNSGTTQFDATTDCTATTYSAIPAMDPTAAHMNKNITTCMASDLFTGAAPTPFMPIKNTMNPTCNLVDAGTNAGAPDHDLIGTKRPQPAGGTDDIGCYEKP